MVTRKDASELPLVKHLEMIQAIIARLAGNAFLLKGWGLTVAGAFFGVSAKEVSWRIAALGLVPALAFWGLDAYFLHRERLFRALYEAVRKGDPAVEPYAMDYRACAPADRGMWIGYWCALRSVTVAVFYGTLVLVGVTVIVATALHWGA
jgi:hypothetical protein